jgi:hypothetical protein
MYAAVTRDEGNAADDVLMVDQASPDFIATALFLRYGT